MNLIAIANVSDGTSTIGFRILDIESKQVKAIPLNNLMNVLNSGKVQVENLVIKDNKIVGSNGSTDRLPKIVNGQLVGKSPLIILNQLGDVGYTVSDYKGTIANVKESDIVKYAKNNGVSNGKVVSKDGKEFISSIEGKYAVKDLDSVVSKAGQKYTGEPVLGMKSLGPLMLTEPDSYKYQAHTKLVGLDSYRPNRTTTKYVVTPSEINLDEITKNLMYEYKGCTLCNCLAKVIEVEDKKNRKEIVNLIRRKAFRESIDNSISNKETYKAKINKKTGIPIPTYDSKYYNVGVDQQLEDTNITYDNLSTEEIQGYVDKLRVMRVKCYIQYRLPTSKKIALIRKCSEEGISYEIGEITNYNGISTKDMTIEEIYFYHKEYDNVTVEGSVMQIVSLDGVYKYDMDLIHQTYNKEIKRSAKSSKAVLLGHTHIEDISVTGDLKKLKSSLKAVGVPNTVKNIENGSIYLSPENTDIIFGSNIEKCGNRAFKSNTGTIKYIEIGGRAARENILNSIYNIKYSLDNCIIHFGEDITPEEYMEVVYNIDRCADITVSNAECINDKFITDVLGKAVSERLNNFNTIKGKIPITKRKESDRNYYYFEIDYCLSNFKDQYKVIKDCWTTKLSTKASAELKAKGDKLFEDADKKIQFRENEAKNTRDKLASVERKKYEEREMRKQMRKNNRW